MSNEELVMKIQGGRRDFELKLWEQCLKFLRWNSWRLLKSYERLCIVHGVTIDDIFQSSYFSFRKAIDTFDPDKGYKFTTYLRYDMRTTICQMLNLDGSKRDMLDFSSSLDVPKGDKEDTTVGDTVVDDESVNIYDVIIDSLFSQQLRDALDNALSELPQKKAYIIRERWYEGKQKTQIADEMGISKSYVSRIETGCYAKLRRNKQLREFRDELLESAAYKHRGINTFRSSLTSTVEAAVIRLVDGE